MGLEAYSTTAANNNSSPPNGAPEGMAPSGVNDCIRQVMADVRSYAEGAEWFNFGHTPTRIDNDTFTVVTDLTALYQVGRRLKVTGSATGYCTITASSYGAPNTTVDVTMDSGNLPGTLSAVYVAMLSVTNPSFPRILSLTSATFSGNVTAASFVPTSTAVNGLGLSASNTPALYSNSTLRWSVNSTGNHTLAAQSSGNLLSISALGSTSYDAVNIANAGGAIFLGMKSTGGGAVFAQGGGQTLELGAQSTINISTGAVAGSATTRVSVGSAGNVTINAPSSGTALAVTGVAGGTSQSWTDGTRVAAIAHSASLVQIGTTTADSFGIFVNNSNKVTVNTGVQVGAPTGGDQGAGTLNAAGNIFVNAVQVATQESGTFTCGYTGFSANPGTTINYARSGNHVILRFPNSTGTSNGSSFVMTGLPAALQPATLQQVVAIGNLIDNGTISASPCIARVNPASGNLEFFPTAGLGGSWSVVGVKGFSGSIVISYMLI